jgi:hypothetical protein
MSFQARAEMAFSDPALVGDGAGMVTSVQAVPSQCLTPPPPTAHALFGAMVATLYRIPELGTVAAVQVLPFQCNAVAWVAPW